MQFEEFLSSDIITFLVGEGINQKEYYINQNFIAEQSSTLRSLITGGMKESKEKKVVFKEVDPRTFVSFARWAMTGRYKIFVPNQDESEQNDSTMSAPVALMPAVQDENPSYPEENTFDLIAESTGARSACDGSLLQHAQVYVFADMYDIPELKYIAFRKFSDLLGRSAIEGTKAAIALSELVRYVYSHTRDDPNPHELRKKVAQYCASNIRFLVLLNEFAELQAEGGYFSIDLMKCVLEACDPHRVQVETFPWPKKGRKKQSPLH